MAELYSVGTNRLYYKAANFALGKTVTAYFWTPSLVKSALQTFTEIELGLYYLDYDFAIAGPYLSLFYENGIKTTMGVFRVMGVMELDGAVYRLTENALEMAPGGTTTGGSAVRCAKTRYLGDYKINNIIYFLWDTNDKNGAAINPSVDGTIRVYANDGTGEVTAPTGITDTRGFDSVTGLHLCRIDLSANSFYAPARDYSVVLVGATIDSQTVNAVLATFSIEKRYSEKDFDYGG